MKMRFKLIGMTSICVGLILQMTPHVWAGPCSYLGFNPASLQDGQLFHSTARSAGWQPFTTFADLKASPGPIRFVYVVRDQSKYGRSGVVVIKSGRKESDPNRQALSNKTILLVRNEAATRFTNICAKQRPNKPFPMQGQRVSAESYDIYHNFAGRDPPELQLLRAFHIAYPQAAGLCRETDSATQDGFFDRKSNRSQFSFDEGRVRGGLFPGIQGLFFGRALASSESLIEQRTEIRRYKTASDGFSCITFEIPRSGPATFLRINDLEARIPPLDVRAPEHAWE
jgi:hypothetical protein